MNRRFKARLLAGVAAAAASTAMSTLSQGAASAQGQPAPQDPPEANEVITVTGSRISRSGFTTPTPVTVVTADELQLASPGNIVTALVQLPQFFNSTTTSDPGGFFTSPGAGNLNLRGLEPSRTLTLLNGRRVVPSTRYGGTDVNTFPEEMIRTVEAVTGGASAAYGTDAVSGVVNFILDTEFTGARAHAQYGITDRGDNANWEGGFSFGTDLGDKAHLLLSGEKYEQEGVFTYDDRDEWYRQWGIVQLPGETIRRVRPGVTSSVATLNGVISAPGTALDRREFLADGVTTRPFVMGPEGNADATAAYQSHTTGPSSSGTDNAVHPNVQPETSRESYFAYADYDVLSSLTVFGQGIWGHNDTTVSDLGGFFGAPFAPLVIFSGNPYLPANIQSTMTTNNIPSITVQKVGSELDTSNRYDVTQNTMYSLTAGFDWDFLEGGVAGGDFLNGWTASSYYQAGQTSYNAGVRGGLRIDRLSNAVDAVRAPNGDIVCRVNTEPFLARNGGRWSDCTPVNLFGQGNASAAGLDYILGYDVGDQVDTVLDFTNSGTSLGLTDSYVTGEDKVSSGEIDQDVFEISFDGEVWKGWGAGPISAAFGYGYREESIFQVVRDPANPTNAETGRPVPPNDNLTDGNVNNDLGVRGGSNPNINNSVAIQFSKVPNIMGKLSTIEYFGETLIPIIAGQPWMDQLNLSLAARRADYSGSGPIWAWKYGFDAQITDDFRLRATQSRDIRAATLSERFDRTGGFANVQCVNPANPTGPRMTCSVFTVSGGNPEVQPETADTTTIGVVYQPGWLDGFSVSLDWYDIALQDAIAALTAQQTYDECVNGDQALCDRIQFNANGTPNLINASVLNVNEAKVAGVDLEAAYRRPIALLGGDESIAARVYVGVLDENSRNNFGAATRYLDEGVLYPELKLNMSLGYTRGPLSLYVQERYQSQTYLNRTLLNDWVEGRDIDDNDIDETWITDINAAYTFDTAQAGSWELFGNVANLFDADPPVVANFANFGQVATQTGGNFDRLGRRYTMGLRVRY